MWVYWGEVQAFPAGHQMKCFGLLVPLHVRLGFKSSSLSIPRGVTSAFTEAGSRACLFGVLGWDLGRRSGHCNGEDRTFMRGLDSSRVGITDWRRSVVQKVRGADSQSLMW